MCKTILQTLVYQLKTSTTGVKLCILIQIKPCPLLGVEYNNFPSNAFTLLSLHYYLYIIIYFPIQFVILIFEVLFENTFQV